MPKQLLALTVVAAQLVFSCPVAAETTTVQPGQTLSDILHSAGIGPLYGKKGAIKKTVELNPGLLAKAGNFLGVGEKLVLPTARESRGLASDPKGENLSPAALPSSPQAPSSPPSSSGEALENESRIKFTTGFEYFRLDATDKRNGAKSTVISKLSPAARLNWDLSWSAHWRSRLRFTIHQDKLLDDSASRRTVQTGGSSRKAAEAGVVRLWADGSQTSATLGFEERLFQYSASINTLNLDHVGTGQIKVGHELALANAGSAHLRVGVQGKIFAPGKAPGYKTKSGYGGDAYLVVTHDRPGLGVLGTLSYGLAKENTDLIRQTQNNVGLSFGLEWKFGD